MFVNKIVVGNTSVSYLRFGDPDGHPMVIIPGVSIKSVVPLGLLIEAQFKLFADKHDIYVIERRESVPDKLSIYDFAEDTITVLDSLGIKNADLYGVSQGGMIALTTACERPDLVRKIAVCSTAAYTDENSQRVFDEWVRLSDERSVPELMRSFAFNVYSDDYCQKHETVFEQFGKTVTEEELERFSVMVRSFPGFDIRPVLGSLKSPVFVIAGEKDRIFRTALSKEIAELTNGKMHIYSGEAHAVYDENADVLKRVKQFFDSEDL